MTIELGLNIALGVISGVLTAMVIWACVLAFNRIFLPWYRKWVYTGLDITDRRVNI